MAQTTGYPRSSIRTPMLVLAATAALAVAVGGFLIAVAFNGEPSKNAPIEALVPAPPAAPAGVITYEVTGKGLFTSDGAGLALGTTTTDKLHAEGLVASPVESAPSPDGRWTASIFRNETDGVYLALTGRDGARKVITQLAGSFDPKLVAGGKGAARAVEGIPLVVAWSPDSSQLAFGSITGAPYSLGILRSPASPNPAITYTQVQGGYVGELAWSPDGKTVAISTYSVDRLNHLVLIADPSTGSVRTLIDGCHITWSPDGRYLAVHRDPGAESGAWVVSATDREDRWVISREEKAFPLTWREG